MDGYIGAFLRSLLATVGIITITVVVRVKAAGPSYPAAAAFGLISGALWFLAAVVPLISWRWREEEFRSLFFNAVAAAATGASAVLSCPAF
jgi:hypothetical protein